MARLTPIKTLSGFDFSFQPSLERSRVTALAALDVIDRHEVGHFIGQSGTGKNRLAIALGVEAVRLDAAFTSPRSPRSSTAWPAPSANGSAFSSARLCQSSTRSATSASAPVPAICSSNWSTRATSVAP